MAASAKAGCAEEHRGYARANGPGSMKERMRGRLPAVNPTRGGHSVARADSSCPHDDGPGGGPGSIALPSSAPRGAHDADPGPIADSTGSTRLPIDDHAAASKADADMHILGSATRQHGVVSREQLIAAGVTVHRIEFRVRKGRASQAVSWRLRCRSGCGAI